MTMEYQNFWGGYQKPVIMEECTVAEGQDLDRGSVLGRIDKAVGDAIADSGNTGDGVIVDDSFEIGTADAKVGVYTVEAVETVDSVTEVATTAGAGDQACSATAGDAYKAGDYVLMCIDATNNDEELFVLYDPDGIYLGHMQAGALGTPGLFVHEQIEIELTGGGAAEYYVVGDFWTITIAEALQDPAVCRVSDPDGAFVGFATLDAPFSAEINFQIDRDPGNAILADSFTFEVEERDLMAHADQAGVDGRQNFVGVLAEDVDASLQNLGSVVIVEGEINQAELEFTGAETADTYRAAARAQGLYFRAIRT